MITIVQALKLKTDTNLVVALSYAPAETVFTQLAQASSVEQLQAAIAIFNRELANYGAV